jgi:hypothetical protein
LAERVLSARLAGFPHPRGATSCREAAPLTRSARRLVQGTVKEYIATKLQEFHDANTYVAPHGGS